MKNKSIKYYARSLFQQLPLAFSSNLVDLNKFLSFELAAFLLSLAKAVNFLQKSNEPNLAAETIAKIAKEKSCRDHDSDNQIENK